MRCLTTTLLSLLLAGCTLALEADQIVLGDMRSVKLFEPSPTISSEMDPLVTKGGMTQDDIPSASVPQTDPITVATSGPPSGGGATCVQRCLARAASQVGCGGSANFWCVCKKGAYVGRAWDCFGQSGCPGDAIGRALGDLNVACQPYRRRFVPDDEDPESPMIMPEGAPVVVSNSTEHDEL